MLNIPTGPLSEELKGAMREGFRKELKDLKREVLGIGRDVTEVTRKAVTSLVTGDVDLAEGVIASDSDIDK
ncbi:MAG: hypothetical protein U1E22_07925, partial [Coriobacteriia bacterium]|nr:hypothetical protein [Coriobacteriia bacterium]